MFQKLRTANFLKVQGDENAIRVGFIGKIARIARVHQDGLNDRAERGSPETRYQQREVLGFTGDDLNLIRDYLHSHLISR
ncbi:phage virion morphogenesis (putative tail completion) protein [Pseudomonas putida]|nr:phage virion morphogenesis (putative tail completion) protein [Pseudomonas putida]